MDQGRVAKSFKYSSTKIITPMKTYDPNDEFDEEYFEFGLFMSRREYKTINRRLQNGRVSSVNEGKYVGSIAPFGYDKKKIRGDKGFTLVKNEDSSIIKTIFDLYAYKDLSLNDVVYQMNNTGLKPMKSEEWSISTIKDILSNPVYIGKIKWNARKEVKIYKNGKIIKSRPRNTDYILKDGLHEAIIEKKTWDIVQSRRAKNPPPVQHNNIIQNPLVGIVFCEKCGKSMQRRPYNKYGKETTLLCNNSKCDNISSKLSIVEEKVLNALKKWLDNFEISKIDYKSKYEKDSQERIIELSSNIKALKNKLEKEESKISNIYSFFEDGTYTKEIFKQRIELVNKDIETIKQNIVTYENEIKKQKEVLKNEHIIIPKVKNVIDMYKLLNTAEEKNVLLKTVLEKVTYLKKEKAIKKDSDLTAFEIKIYPKVPKI